MPWHLDAQGGGINTKARRDEGTRRILFGDCRIEGEERPFGPAAKRLGMLENRERLFRRQFDAPTPLLIMPPVFRAAHGVSSRNTVLAQGKVPAIWPGASEPPAFRRIARGHVEGVRGCIVSRPQLLGTLMSNLLPQLALFTV